MLKLNTPISLTVSLFIVVTSSILVLVDEARGEVIFKSEVNKSVVTQVWYGCTGLEEENFEKLTSLTAGDKIGRFRKNSSATANVTITCRFVRRKLRAPTDFFLGDSEEVAQAFKNETSQRDQRFTFYLTEQEISSRTRITILVTDDVINITRGDSTTATYRWEDPMYILPPIDPAKHYDKSGNFECRSRCEERAFYKNVTKCLTVNRRSHSTYRDCTVESHNVKDNALNRILTIRGVPCRTNCSKTEGSRIFKCLTRKNDTRSEDSCSPNPGDDHQGRDCITHGAECTKPCAYRGNDFYKTCDVMAESYGRLQLIKSPCSYDDKDEVLIEEERCEKIKADKIKFDVDALNRTEIAAAARIVALQAEIDTRQNLITNLTATGTLGAVG